MSPFGRTAWAWILVLALSETSWGEPRRAPNADELAGLKTAQSVTVLDGGTVVDRLSVSADGRWMAYAFFEENVASNAIRLVSTDGKVKKVLEVPYGYKDTPLFYDSRNLFFTLDAPPGSSWEDGIYFGPWDGAADRWILFEKGSFRDLALSDDGRFLAASKGNWDRAKVRSSVWVWPLGSGGVRTDAPYSLAPGLIGQVHQIAWGPEARSLVFELRVDKAGTAFGVTNLYSAPNRASAPARLLREGASRPVLGNQDETATLYFIEGDWRSSKVLAYRPGDRDETEVAALTGLTANGLAWDRAGKRLLLGLQRSSDVAGIVGLIPPR